MEWLHRVPQPLSSLLLSLPAHDPRTCFLSHVSEDTYKGGMANTWHMAWVHPSLTQRPWQTLLINHGSIGVGRRDELTFLTFLTRLGAGDKECHPHSTQEDLSEACHPDALLVSQRGPNLKPWTERGGCEEQ